MGGLFVLLVYRYRRAAQLRKDSQNSDSSRTGDPVPRVNRAIRRLRAAVIALPIMLICGLWATRGEPLLPRLTGCAVNLLFTGYFLFLLRKAKKADTA